MYGLLRPRHRTAPAERFDQRADMCSLCDALHLDYGITGRALNNYDAIFLATLTAAQNPALRQNQLDPVRGACTRFLKAPTYHVEPYFELAANVSVLLAALRLKDQLTDAKGWSSQLSPKRRVLARWLKPRLQTAREKTAKFGLAQLDPHAATLQQKALEMQPGVTLEELSQVTAEWLGEILAATARIADRPANEQPLRELGNHLGRQIYIFDALDDMDEDLQSGDFNALLDTGNLLVTIPNRKDRRVQANLLGQQLLAQGQQKLTNLLAAVELEANAPLVERMLLDNRMLWQIDPALLTTAHSSEQTQEPTKVGWQTPLINRSTPEPTHTCKTKAKPHRVGLLAVAVGLAALPLQADGCDCCCDCCAAEGDLACCCLELECCNCCCGGCGGGGGRRYGRGRGPYYDQYPPNYPPPGYGPPRRRRRFW